VEIRLGSIPGDSNVGFVADSMALQQVLLQVLHFFPVNIILPGLYTYSVLDTI